MVMRRCQLNKAETKPASSTPQVMELVSKTPTSSPPCQSLTVPTWQLARGYMYTNFMIKSHHHGTYLPCLAGLAERWPSSALPAAITAVGLAALANIYQSPQAMVEARQECTAAISLTRQALNDPLAARRDDVLAAVVMLSIFEVSPHPCLSHNGTVTGTSRLSSLLTTV